MRPKLAQDEFCKQFVAAFCGAWCAKNYEDACMRGEQERLENPPMEDAALLADTAWTQYVEAVLKYRPTSQSSRPRKLGG